MKILQSRLYKQIGVGILIGLVFVLALGVINPLIASADGGGVPTQTPTITRTPEITLVDSTATPTVTFTSLPPYPLESSGEVQPVQQQVASSPTVLPGAQTIENESTLGGCFPTGILLLLAGILLVTFFFARRTRRRPEQ